MLEFVTIRTLVILLVVFVILLKKYGKLLIIHPSIWFLSTWIMSTFSLLIFIVLDFDWIFFYNNLIIELLNYIAFTAICFLVIGLHYKKTNYRTIWSVRVPLSFFKLFSIVVFVLNVALLLNQGFDLASNRIEMLGNERLAYETGQLPIFKLLTNIITSFNKPLLIYSGYKISYLFLNKKILPGKSLYYFLPILSEIISTLSIGGRAGMIYMMVNLFFGIGIALSTKSKNLIFDKRKFIISSLILASSFGVYSTTINILRAEFDNGTYESKFEGYKILETFSGIFQYMTDHYPGYQLRRTESENEPKTYGEFTFSGITAISIPFSSQIAGKPVSIQTIFGLNAVSRERDFSLKRASLGYLWPNTTTTIYLFLYRDFGYWGAFVAIFFLVLITQRIFESFLRKRVKRYFISIVPLLLMYTFFSQTIFGSFILSSWILGFIYFFGGLDILLTFFNRNSINKVKR